MGLTLAQQRVHSDLQPFPVLWQNQHLEIRRRHGELARSNSVDRVLALVPDDVVVHKIPVPRTHAAGGKRKAAPLLAFKEPQGRGLQLGRARGDAFLELRVQPLELAILAIQIGKHPDLGAQHLRHHGNRYVIDRTHFVAAQMVDLGKVDCRNEDHRNPLETRVLPDHRCELEAVQLRHADIHQDDGDLGLEQLLQRLLAGRGLDQVLAQFAQDHLVGEQLRGLVVDQQDVDLVVRGHGMAGHQRCSHMRSADRSCSVFTGLAR